MARRSHSRAVLRLANRIIAKPRDCDNGTGAKNLMTATASEDHHDQ